MPGEGRSPSSRPTQDVVRDLEIGQPSNSEKCSETADGITREAKAEAGYRFYALYDKISRDDILVHAYAQCRSNKGAAGIDGQDLPMGSSGGWRNWRLHS